jgi:hypothetical protein
MIKKIGKIERYKVANFKILLVSRDHCLFENNDLFEIHLLTEESRSFDCNWEF